MQVFIVYYITDQEHFDLIDIFSTEELATKYINTRFSQAVYSEDGNNWFLGKDEIYIQPWDMKIA